MSVHPHHEQPLGGADHDLELDDRALAAAVELAQVQGVLQKSATGAVVHCPLMLSPTLLPAHLHAQLEALIAPSAALAHAVASQLDFLTEQLQATAAVDEYIDLLLTLAIAEHQHPSPYRFAITRSDYFVTPTPAGAALRQVEFNTIAASYLGLSQRIVEFHRLWGQKQQQPWDVAPNQPADDVADSFVAALQAYGEPTAGVLFVVQRHERNVFDQRILEAALLQRGIAVTRLELDEIGTEAQLREGHLVIHGQIMAITYFRAGYRPDELYTEAARQGRKLIATSSTISVPDLATHLSGMKKIQQVLTQPAVLRQFLPDADASFVEQSFATIAALEDEIIWDGQAQLALDAAIAAPERFVLKPQREGGGFNIYGDDIRHQLQTMTATARSQYILMERLHPLAVTAAGLREGVYWRDEVVSELGQFGVLFADQTRPVGTNPHDTLLWNRGVGYLVRTKSRTMDEGGISAGAGHLSSIAIAPAEGSPA